jgi:hypothetical protein
MAFLAGLFSLASGLLVARLAGVDNAFLAFALAAAVAFGGIGLAGLLAWLSRDRTPRIDGKELVFDLEIRPPAGASAIGREPGEFYAYLSAGGAGMERAILDFAQLREDEGRWLLPGIVQLSTGRPGPYIAIGGRRVNNTTVYFHLDQQGTLRERLEEWSAWMRGLPAAGTDPASDAAGFELRVRLRQA